MSKGPPWERLSGSGIEKTSGIRHSWIVQSSRGVIVIPGARAVGTDTCYMDYSLVTVEVTSIFIARLSSNVLLSLLQNVSLSSRTQLILGEKVAVRDLKSNECFSLISTKCFSIRIIPTAECCSCLETLPHLRYNPVNIRVGVSKESPQVSPSLGFSVLVSPI